MWKPVWYVLSPMLALLVSFTTCNLLQLGGLSNFSLGVEIPLQSFHSPAKWTTSLSPKMKFEFYIFIQPWVEKLRSVVACQGRPLNPSPIYIIFLATVETQDLLWRALQSIQTIPMPFSLPPLRGEWCALVLGSQYQVYSPTIPCCASSNYSEEAADQQTCRCRLCISVEITTTTYF